MSQMHKNIYLAKKTTVSIFIRMTLCTHFYFRASDRGDSPWCSSLNHSYETLNMPDSASDNDPSATPLKNPHR